MTKTELYSNTTIRQLLDDLELMQHYLLMVKAAALAFDGKFNEHCSYIPARSPFSKEEAAEYFICQFLELDPDAKLEQAMQVINELNRSQVNQLAKNGTDNATIRISVSRD